METSELQSLITYRLLMLSMYALNILYNLQTTESDRGESEWLVAVRVRGGTVTLQ
jgi:hypothetical protein